MAEEIDLEKFNFRQFSEFRSTVILTLTLDRVKVISACTVHIALAACPTN